MQEKSDVREVVKSLNALAMKYNSERNTANKQTKSPPSLSSKKQLKKKKNGYYKKHELELWCQEASYLVLGRYSKYDSAVAAAISLLALVARDEKVRERNIEQADIYGFNIPIRAMRDSLHRTQLCDAPLERQERLAAELQRKGCLYLGAISDGDMDIATKVVDEDGLIAIFEALKWFCKHSHVCNWALWATFILCYDHMGNKAQLVRLGGINAISNILRQMSEELEVSRHAIAILFDLMREVPNSVTDVARIRTIALNAGVHESVAKAMSNNNNSAEIYMMGQQILVGTGYAGNIPDYTGPAPKL